MNVEKIRKICVIAFIVVGLACIFVEKANALFRSYWCRRWI